MTKIEINGTDYQVIYESLRHDVSCMDCDYHEYCVHLHDKPCEEFQEGLAESEIVLLKELY